MSLSTQAELSPHFIQSDGIKYMILLISHENIDISIDIINFFADLIDQDLDTEYQDDIIELYNFIVIINIFITKGGKEFRAGHYKEHLPIRRAEAGGISGGAQDHGELEK